MEVGAILGRYKSRFQIHLIRLAWSRIGARLLTRASVADEHPVSFFLSHRLNA